MKLLLTSEGLYNKSIEKAFFDLVGKSANKIKLTVIPTSAHMAATNNKTFVFETFGTLGKLGLGQIDIADIAAIPKDEFLPRLEKADAIFVIGGNVKFLLDWMKKTGLYELLPELIRTKVYVGCSAGSIMMGKKLTTSPAIARIKEGFKGENGFGFVDFSIRPHHGRADKFTSTKDLQKIADQFETDLYAIDDDTAIMVNDGKIKIISEGKWEKFEK